MNKHLRITVIPPHFTPHSHDSTFIPSECFIGGAINLAPPSHRTSIALNFHRPCSHRSLPSHPFPVLLRRTPSVGLARIAPVRTLMCVSLFDLATSACSSPCVAAFLSSILPQLCRTENQDAIDAAIVGMLADPKEARAGIREVHFFPFNPGDKRTALTYIESDGNWHRSSKDIEPLQLQRGCEEKGYATIVKFAEHGLRFLGVARQVGLDSKHPRAIVLCATEEKANECFSAAKYIMEIAEAKLAKQRSCEFILL
ncbi:hypothetical protein Ahy_Scaffold6g107884 isoform B [Arachis hypogaea]|uniref:Uncharacterized protein n=1 Tax=Arachis hypogaea TaxID=3818 RepID=A0A444WPD7_ARAHY|nr:hypothetical protein Ahy_Scaffold6g107884 isoform B [Arachis hypogaea]